jgi:hypothetical protein
MPGITDAMLQALSGVLATGFGRALAVGLLILGGIRAWEVFRSVSGAGSPLGDDEKKFAAWFGDADRREAAEFRAWWQSDSSPRRRGLDWMLGYGEYRAARSRRRRERFQRDMDDPGQRAVVSREIVGHEGSDDYDI